MILLQTDPGLFAPVVGYVGAIFAAIFLIQRMAMSKTGIWKSPEEDLPETAPRIVAIISGIIMVFVWLYASPDTMDTLFTIAITCGIILVISYLIYYFCISVFVYKKEKKVANTVNETESVDIIGGFLLKKSAKETKEKKKIASTQELFAGAAYDPDKLWSRTSRSLTKTVIIFLFLVIMVSGTIGITSAGFAVQVDQTGKAATEIISTEDSPGLENSRIQSEKENSQTENNE